jgi:hypothetical protein
LLQKGNFDVCAWFAVIGVELAGYQLDYQTIVGP